MSPIKRSRPINPRYASRIGVTIAMLVAPSFAFAQQAVVTLDPTQLGATISSRVIGANMGVWFDPTLSGLTTGLANANIRAMRWPGGSMSDLYHWQSNTTCAGGYAAPQATFDNFMTSIVNPLSLDLAVTLNYGTNAACNGGGDPTEAAAWVAYAKSRNYPVTWWTVGNENYGSWEADMHAAQWDPATYANAVATGYYPAIKAANPSAQVGVVVDAQSQWGTANWDQIVLTNASYDFVEYHWYAQGAGYENDNYLLTQTPQQLTAAINLIKQELAAVGRANTPIMVGELGSVVGARGKQMMSITQALFAGEVLGELMTAGVARAHWYTAYGDCYDNDGTGNFSSSLYGWQNFGGYEILSDGLPSYKCAKESIPRGTLFPTAQALKLMSLVARDGERMMSASISGTNAADIRAYAMTNNGGKAVVLFNLNQSQSRSVRVSVPGAATAAVTLNSYDRAAYDQSRHNVWAGATTQSLGVKALPLSLNLTPWSMTVVQMK